MMECQDIRKDLAAYREGMVSPEDRELMEQHLASCRSCGDALHELNRAAEAVKNLKEVEPPPWMKQKIMARVREEAERKKGFFQKIFYPLHIKVPLEAFATVLIAVVAVYVFKAVEPQMENLQAPSPREPVISRQEAPYPAKAPAAEAPAKAEKAAPAAETERKKAASADLAEKASNLEAKKDLQAQPAPPSFPPPAESKKEVFAAKSAETPPGSAESRMAQAPPPPPAYAPAPPEREAQAPKAAGPPGIMEARRAPEPSPQPPAAASRPRLEESQSAARSTARDAQELKKTRPAAPSLGAAVKRKAEPLAIRVRAKDIRAAGVETVGLLNQADAVAIVRDSRPDAEVITAGVKAERVKDLIERLQSIGEVEEKDARPDPPAMDTALRIEIVPGH